MDKQLSCLSKGCRAKYSGTFGTFHGSSPLAQNSARGTVLGELLKQVADHPFHLRSVVSWYLHPQRQAYPVGMPLPSLKIFIATVESARCQTGSF